MAWTYEEDAVLTNAIAQGVSLQRLTIRLNKSKSSILKRAGELGLTIKNPARQPIKERSQG
jgi:hypothetical protein